MTCHRLFFISFLFRVYPNYLQRAVLRIVKETENKDEAVEKLQGLIENKNSIFLGNQCREKIEECCIWIPYYEVEKYHCSKKNKYRKRYENANLSAAD